MATHGGVMATHGGDMATHWPHLFPVIALYNWTHMHYIIPVAFDIINSKAES